MECSWIGQAPSQRFTHKTLCSGDDPQGPSEPISKDATSIIRPRLHRRWSRQPRIISPFPRRPHTSQSTDNEFPSQHSQPTAHIPHPTTGLQPIYPLFATRWLGSQSTQEDNIGVFQQDEEDTNSLLPAHQARPSESDHEDSDTEYDSYDMDEADNESYTGPQPHYVVPGFDNLSDSDTQTMPALIPCRQDEEDDETPPRYSTDTPESRVEAVSPRAQITVERQRSHPTQHTVPFSIKHIRILCSPTTPPRGTPTHLHQDPEVGSKHQTVLASWKTIFGPVQTPRATPDPPAVPPATERQPRRSRQQRLPEMENGLNKPHIDWMQQKEPGYSRVYFINPRESATIKDF
jgi:hypothetical protein